jgi:hypothetical protein
MHTYRYEGPVLKFEKVMTSNWTAVTRAVSKEKALCNFAYQFKIQNGKTMGAKITLPGKITIVEQEEQDKYGSS